MAHGDYECCAVCDCKMTYNGMTEEHKTDICADCREKYGVPATLKQFLATIAASSKEDLAATLPLIGFEFCFYQNPVDDAVRAKLGLDPVKQFKSSAEWIQLLKDRKYE